MTDALMPGRYTLPDGREFVVLDDFEVRARARESWKKQNHADGVLADRMRLYPAYSPPAALPRVWPAAYPQPGVTGDLFSDEVAE